MNQEEVITSVQEDLTSTEEPTPQEQTVQPTKGFSDAVKMLDTIH